MTEPAEGNPTTRPCETLGMRHVALSVEDVAACERFYVGLLGMRVAWRPDEHNLYLTSGNDNLALHQGSVSPEAAARGRLDHIGFFLPTPEAVDDWHRFLKANGVPISKAPKTHRDGARSFYCRAPDGTSVQMIYHPPISGAQGAAAQERE